MEVNVDLISGKRILEREKATRRSQVAGVFAAALASHKSALAKTPI
jgi:hypothetical protein